MVQFLIFFSSSIKCSGRLLVRVRLHQQRNTKCIQTGNHLTTNLTWYVHLRHSLEEMIGHCFKSDAVKKEMKSNEHRMIRFCNYNADRFQVQQREINKMTSSQTTKMPRNRGFQNDLFPISKLTPILLNQKINKMRIYVSFCGMF